MKRKIVDLWRYLSRYNIILWICVLEILALSFLWGIHSANAASSVKIEDKSKSGYKVNVDKVGTEYGIQTIKIGDKYSICNKDDDATPNYYGFEASDGSWIIMKWTVSAGADVFAYDSGTSGYESAYTARVSGSYTSYGVQF